MPGNEAVALQLSIKARVPRGVILTRSFLDEVVRHWADTGAAPRGMEISITDWKHENRRKVRVSRAEQRGARIRFGRLLRAGRFTVSLRDR